VDQKRHCIKRLESCIADLRVFDPSEVKRRHNLPEVTALEADIDSALSEAFGHGTPPYARYRQAASLDNGPHIMRMGPDLGGPRNYDAQDAHDAQKFLAEGKDQAIALLGSAIRTLESEIIRTLEDQIAENNKQLSLTVRGSVGAEAKGPAPRKVFIVHGHDEGARETVARFLERIGFEAIILHEQANQGRTVIEKVVAHGNVGFAVVLLTPDDEGCKKGEAVKPRARQNVVLELGYFVGRLGRDRVCALKRGDVELPSDFGGVVYEPFDEGGGWRQALGRELQAAGFAIDWNVVMRA
jgi:predicted nucleotide-binding protein